MLRTRPYVNDSVIMQTSCDVVTKDHGTSAAQELSILATAHAVQYRREIRITCVQLDQRSPTHLCQLIIITVAKDASTIQLPFFRPPK